MADDELIVGIMWNENVPLGIAWLLDADGKRIGETALEPGFKDRLPSNVMFVVMSPMDHAIWEEWVARKGIKPVTIN